MQDENDLRANAVANLMVHVYAIRETVIVESGGMPGHRDAGMLRPAAARPFTAFGGEDLYADEFQKVAALFHSLMARVWAFPVSRQRGGGQQGTHC